MPRIDCYLLTRFLSLFGFFALVLVAVYWINRAVRLFEQLLSDGQTALVVLEFTALTLPTVIATVLPVAAFAATAYGTNRLAGESELVAMRAAGLSPWRMARPVLIFGLGVALIVAVLVHVLVPMARERLADRQSELAENVVGQFLRAGDFQYPATGLTLFIRDIASDGRLLDLFLEDARNPADQSTYTAQEALVVRGEHGPVLVMLNGMVQNMQGTQDGLLSITRFDELSYDLGALIGGRAARGRDLRDYDTPSLLRADPQVLESTGASAAQARLEAHERISQPLQAPIAVMIGFATLLIGGYSRFGVWRQVFWAVIGLISVQFMINAAANAAGRNPAQWWLPYMPMVAGAVICLFLLWLAARPFPPPRRAGGVA
ncbi:MAG: LPS export ABC transporter permease LptF [Paracoccus sp. (in: a-proteobacteria)]|uniref:LPS export ABC transporter permease LptF n=1 Tax=Paracoccus sp. TaxID=267 RepID=UPI0026E004E4|nr:LPS export ABC transporter permease LptF [Paracoccus sp. (in: a-proteobacteria)]MDO5633126.1 LPS export ABC transporter permease LptF [Paracoccus sp. (in: a-proteobacteria)]